MSRYTDLRAVQNSFGIKADRRPTIRAFFYAPGTDGVTDVPGRPGYHYALVGAKLVSGKPIGGAVTIVRSPRIAPINGLPIIISQDDYSPGIYEVQRADYDAIDGWAGESYDVPPHTHGVDTGTPVFVGDDQLIVGLCQPTTPTSNAVIIPRFCYYDYSGNLTTFTQQTTSSLLTSLPTPGKSKWVTVSITPGTANYALTAGAEFPYDTTTPEAYLPSIPDGNIGAGDVWIDAATTVITQRMIYGARRVIVDTPTNASTAAFNRLIAGPVTLAAEKSVIVWQYVTLAAGGSLAIADGAALVIEGANRDAAQRSISTSTGMLGGDTSLIASGTITLTLPPADECYPRPYTVINIGSGVVSVLGYSGALINGVSQQRLSPNDGMSVYQNGANWRIS